MNYPRVTVLIAVYNGEPFLQQAIKSVLEQTYTDFELLIVDDASSDNTNEIILSFLDERIRLIRNENNQGAAYSRNRGIENALGDFIAVLDADDIMYSHRLSSQAAFLDAHPEIALVGGAYDIIDKDGNKLQTMAHPADPIVLRWKLLFRNPIATSASTFRKAAALAVGGYDQRYLVGEDFSFNVRLSQHHLLAQLSDTVGAYRVHGSGLTGPNPGKLHEEPVKVSQENIGALIGKDVELSVVYLLNGKVEKDTANVQELEKAYEILEDCLNIFMNRLAKNRRERYLVLLAAIDNFRTLAAQSWRYRYKVVWLALKVASRNAPQCLLTLPYVRFFARMVIPTPAQ
jgi:glycosyltransferase involved in cell wall biosynthesis